MSFRQAALLGMVAAVLEGSAQAQTLKRLEQGEFGKAQDGSVVKLITLRNAKGRCAEIITYGAIIKQLQAPDRGGKFTNMLLTTDSLEKFEHFNGAAAIIGRVVNRIRGAQFELAGTTDPLTVNEKKNSNSHGC
jgi:aldose 1-epimerase